MVKYLDFDLQISREGDRYVAQVRDSPAGSSPRVPLNWPFTEEHHSLLLQLELAVTRAHGYRGGLMSNDEKTLRQFGSSVFNAVFRDAPGIFNLYSQSLSQVAEPNLALRLKLRVDPPELSVLPWEYVYDAVSRDDFVCLEEKLPVVRFLEGESTRPIVVDRPLRILAMIANPAPGGALDTEKERRRIDKVFQSAAGGEHEFRWVQGGTLEDLFRVLQDGPWDVFHFIGHGGTDAFDDNGVTKTVGYVLMHDGKGGAAKVYASRLARVFRQVNLRLAVLNCCDSGRGPGFSSLGATLVKSSIPAVVAMQFPISDDGASRFSEEFYSSLLKGEPVEKALTQARNFIYVSEDSTLEWGIPVLFTRTGPSGIFSRATAAAPMLPLRVRTAADSPAAPVVPASAAPAPALTDAQQELRRLWGDRL